MSSLQVQIFMILSIVLAIIPLLVWFVRNIARARNKNNYSYKYEVAMKWSMIILWPTAILFVVLTFLTIQGMV